MREITPIQINKEGRTTQIIQNEFPRHPMERFFFVAYTQAQASNAKPIMRKVWGDKYVENWVDCREVKGIHKWGLGLWHDKFVFDHSVWDMFSDLAPEDQQFMLMLTQEQSIGEFFTVRKNINFEKKPSGLFGRFRQWLKSKL